MKNRKPPKRRFLRFCLLLVAVLLLLALRHLWPRQWRYRLDLALPVEADEEPQGWRVGASAVAITPTVDYTFEDQNGDGYYRPKEGDRLRDRQGRETKRAVWLAGFGPGRPATGVHDDLWARTVVFDDGRVRLAITAVDLIGFFYPDVIDVRRSLPAEWDVDHLIIASTHTHNGPDTMGLWGRTQFSRGVDWAYLRRVKEGIRQSVREAVDRLQPAEIRVASLSTGTEGFVRDSRPPKVIDDTLTLLRCTARSGGVTLATIIHWSNHPEVLGGHNTQVTSDFCHYLREGVEKGLTGGPEGVGGVAIYWNGAIGGLMTPLGVKVPDRDGKTIHEGENFETCQALGENLAALALGAIHEGSMQPLPSPLLSVRAKTVFIPFGNPLLMLGLVLGVIPRGSYGLKFRTEVDYVRLGTVDLLTVPGELYPEIAIGGIESPKGGDFPGEPLEVPPLKDLLSSEHKLILGLANDEVGYLLPQTEWDVKPPHIYGRRERPYGEIVSPGPQAATVLHREIRALVGEWRGEAGG